MILIDIVSITYLVIVSTKMVKHFCVYPTVEPLDGFITKSPILFNFTTLLTKSGKRALDETLKKRWYFYGEIKM